MKYLFIKNFQAIAEIEAKDRIEAYEIGLSLEGSDFEFIDVEDIIEEYEIPSCLCFSS